MPSIQKATASKDYIEKAKLRLKKAESAYKSEVAKERNGRDLVCIFYALMGTVLFIATLQMIAYHIANHQQTSIFYKMFNDFFVALGFDTTTRAFGLQFFGIPLNIIIDGATLFTFGYGGGEGTIAFVKTLSMDGGQFTLIPERKIRRLFRFIWVWFVVSFLLAIYQMTILSADTSQVTFFLDKTFTGFVTSSIVYLYARKGPKVVADLSINGKKLPAAGCAAPGAESPTSVGPSAPAPAPEPEVSLDTPLVKNPTAVLSPGGN